MAAADDRIDAEAKVRRRVTRTIVNRLILIVSFGVLGGWVWQGVYTLELGESAVILWMGAFSFVDSYSSASTSARAARKETRSPVQQ